MPNGVGRTLSSWPLRRFCASGVAALIVDRPLQKATALSGTAHRHAVTSLSQRRPGLVYRLTLIAAAGARSRIAAALWRQLSARTGTVMGGDVVVDETPETIGELVVSAAKRGEVFAVDVNGTIRSLARARQADADVGRF
jgi:hypothetical protein